ncbi:MAG: hypothetical protein HC806_09430 [Anaerolineae bacterium]|nr:hypothetical protein [Anaerolineae bacterium]
MESKWFYRILLLSLILLFQGCAQPPVPSPATPTITISPTPEPDTPVPPTPTPTLDFNLTATAIAQATQQASQTLEAIFQATLSVKQTEFANAQATSLAPTMTPFMVPLSDPTPGKIFWNQTAALPIPSSASQHIPNGMQVITHNGFIYLFGGRATDGDEILTTTYFSAIHSDGSLEGWQVTTPLPGDYVDHHEIRIGNFVYMITGAAGADDVFYAPFNADGTLGSWKRTEDLLPSRQTFAVANYENFIYAIGGNSGGLWNRVQFTSIKEDGSLNRWFNTTSLPVDLQEHTAIAANGYLYVLEEKL